MSSHSFTHWIEIPVEVCYEYQPAERMTLTYPGCRESVSVDDVEIPDKDEIGKNLPDNETLNELAWEDFKESH